nr:hypothetical protein [Tanacetum cinerariifolium]
MDKSWMGTNRTNKSYVDGVASFIDYAVHNLQKMGNIDLRVNKQHLLMPCPHIEKDEPSVSSPKPVNATTEFVDDTDFALDIPTDGLATVEMVNATKDNFVEDDLVKIQEILLDADKPLYEGCLDFTKLSAIVKLLNLKGKYGAFDKFFIELLGLIKKMLPAGNEMVEKTYQAKKVMKLMGSGYKKIHVCINNCLLYWKDDKDLTTCRTCGISRLKVDNKTHKVYENIPAKDDKDLTTCRTCGISRLKVDNKTHKVYENIPAKAWCTIDEKFLKIVEDPRNLRLGISADGVDVNTGNRHHSVWPVLTVIYNLPPCGFKGCVVCGKDTNCVRLSASSKQSYAGHRRYLPYNHLFRKQKKAFNGQHEFLSAPILMTGEQIYNENVVESPIGTLLHVPGKTKDKVNARLDLAELGVKPEFFAMQEEDKTTLPPAGYTLTNAEKDTFCETLHNIRVPQGYCSNFSSLVNLKDRKLIGLNRMTITC